MTAVKVSEVAGCPRRPPPPPPTDLKARTGEDTPPGISSRASAMSASDLVVTCCTCAAAGRKVRPDLEVGGAARRGRTAVACMTGVTELARVAECTGSWLPARKPRTTAVVA